jgi:hypothetical protein
VKNGTAVVRDLIVVESENNGLELSREGQHALAEGF